MLVDDLVKGIFIHEVFLCINYNISYTIFICFLILRSGDGWVYYKAILMAIPILLACTIVAYVMEYNHITHLKHEQV